MNSSNSENLVNHCGMSWSQFKNLFSHMCLADTVVASRSFTQEVSGSIPFTVMTNIFVTEFAEFSENI